MQRPAESRARELGLLAFAISMLLLASPLRMLWSRPETHWLVPFAIWLGIVLLAGLAVRRRRDR